MHTLAQPLTTEAFAFRIQNAKGSHELIEYLPEDHTIYQGRSAADIVRMRGWLILNLATDRVPASAIPFLLEELESGHDAYLVAAAARTIRSTAPNPTYTPFVLNALRNNAGQDEPVSLDVFGEISSGTDTTSIVHELLETLAWLGPNAANGLGQIESMLKSDLTLESSYRCRLQTFADSLSRATPSDCCDWSRGPQPISIPFDRSIRDIPFEDQDETRMTFAELFCGQPTIVAFFYTRCDNPLKCSLVMSKLSQLQKRLSESNLHETVRIVAITYDPNYDLPHRLKNYATSRGFQFDERNRIVRTISDFDILRSHFQLGVNFSTATVNRHRLELLVLDADGAVNARFERFHWKEEDVVEVVRQLNAERSNLLPRSRYTPLLGALASIGYALFPKCPYCWATYFSFLGSLGFGTIPYSPWLQPILAILMFLNLAMVGWRSRSSRTWFPIVLVALGAVSFIIYQLVVSHPLLATLGVVVTICGSFWSGLRTRSHQTVDPVAFGS